MSAYYNENDPYAAQWLRNLIAAGHIADGEVDERSIVDVRASDLDGFRQCHFFAGIGGWSLALRMAGWPDDRPVWTGSCPCQPFSVAGKRKGFDDERHLWPVWKNLIEERGPSIIFGEQVASASEWLRLVRGDLEALGYAVGAIPVQAASAGAEHFRDRYWFVADADDTGSQGRAILPERASERIAGADGLADADCPRECGRSDEESSSASQGQGEMGEQDRQRIWLLRSGARRSGYLVNANVTCESEGREQRGGQQCGAGGNQETRHSGDMVNAMGIPEREPDDQGDTNADFREARPISCGSGDHLEWVIGADGKARRVKSGIRLLAHGIPNRVAKLRAFGNAIDPRPASQVIRAFLTSSPA